MAEKRLGRKRLGAAYVVLGITLLGGSGCLVIAAGATGGAALGYFYYQGEICHNYNAPLENTFDATRAALTDLGMPLVRQEFNGGNASMESLTTGQHKVHISFTLRKSQGPTQGFTTRVGVRVGVFGDEEASARLLDQIEARLGNAAPARLVPQVPPGLGPIQPVSAVAPPGQTPPPPLAESETMAPPLKAEPIPVHK